MTSQGSGQKNWTSQGPAHKKIDQSGPGPQSWARVVGPTGPTLAGKIYNCTGTTMASAGRVKVVARRSDECVTQTAVHSLRGRHVPSPLLSPDDDDCDEERKKIRSCFGEGTRES